MTSHKVIEKLERIQFLLIQLENIIGEEFLSHDLKEIIDEVNPTLRVAFMGEVSSGKSSLISSLLHQQGTDYFTSISGSNETSVPVYIKYAEQVYIRVRYFSSKIIHFLDGEIEKLEINKDNNLGSFTLFSQVRDVIKNNNNICQAISEDKFLGIADEVNLENLDTKNIFQKLRYYSGASSSNQELDCIAQVDFGFDNDFLRTTKNLEFIDCVGLGEPNPVTNLKLEQVLENDLDLIIFVFSDEAIRESFTNIVNHKSINELIRQGRFIILINKIDTFPEKQYKASKINRLLDNFKYNLARSCPLIKDNLDEIQYFSLSLHAIEGKLHGKWLKNESKALKNLSIRQLNEMRDYFVNSQYSIDKVAKHLSAFQGQLTSVFSFFELLGEETETKIEKSKSFVDIFNDLIPQMEEVSNQLQRTQNNGNRNYLKLIEQECNDFVQTINWDSYANSVKFTQIGISQSLFREITNFAQELSKKIYDDELSNLYNVVMEQIDNQVKIAFEKYAETQDTMIQHNLQTIIDSQPEDISYQPFYVSLQGQRELFSSTSKDSLAETNRRRKFSTFANQYFRKCKWDTPQKANVKDLKEQLSNNLENCFQAYINAYYLGKGSFAYSWDKSEFIAQQAKSYFLQINKVLENHLKIYQNARRLYTSQLYIQGNREKIRKHSHELMDLAKEVSSIF